MKNVDTIIKALEGKKTYLVAAIMVIAAGLHVQGYLTDAQVEVINIVLVALGFSALRIGMKK